ncbi:MAG: hypothetical protein JST80_07830 [Bdellovibrionales bacterium]|nr:hypothetical protein [Bdellovibrionales bacterium]
MKRFSFKSVSLFSALAVIFASTAFAQTKSRLDLLKEGPWEDSRQEIKDDALANMHLLVTIQDKAFQLESDVELPKVCLDRLEFTDMVATKPNLGSKNLKDALSEVKTQADLKAISTKYTPVVAFSGTKEIPKFENCLAEAGAIKDIEKAKAKIAPVSKKTLENDELAFLSTGKIDDKTDEFLSDKSISSKYLTLSTKIKRVNCKDCNKTAEDKTATNKDSTLPALTQKGAEDELDSAVKSVLDAKTANTLDAALAKLIGLPDKIEDYQALDLDYKKKFQQDVHDVAKKVGSKKIEELGNATCSKSSFDAQLALFSKSVGETKSSSDYWGSFQFKRKDDGRKADDASCASDYVQKQADLLSQISKFKYIDSDVADQDKQIADEILEKGNIHRIEQLSKMNETDEEITKAVFVAQQNYRRIGNQFAPQCSQLHNDDYANCVRSQMSVQCSNVNDYRAYARCVTATTQFDYYASFRVFDARSQLMSAQNSFVTGPFGMSYQNVGTNIGSSNSNAFSLNQNVFPNASQWNTSSGLNNQNTAFNPNLMYQNSSQWNRMQPNDPRATTTLPVAIPLNSLGNPSMQFGQYQFQNMS